MPGRTYFQKLQVRQVDISPVMSLPDDSVVFAEFETETVDAIDIGGVSVWVFAEEHICHFVGTGDQGIDLQGDAKGAMLALGAGVEFPQERRADALFGQIPDLDPDA